ncbi:MAG: hypothetical protein DSY82_01675, partial [Flavobacteriia bacterium]
MKKIRLFYLTLIFPVFLFAQGREITGTVHDELDGPLPDASVVVKGSTKGVSTDFDGNFTITVDDGQTTLVISYVGYKDYVLNLTPASHYTIKLEPEDNTLDEVIVVGYGSSAKRDITGSLSEVKEEANVAAQYKSVGALLQGRSSGLQVTSNSGSPGAPTSIRIRGANSLRGNNEPLYVIDGVIINSAGEDVLNASSDANEIQQTQNGLTGLNPRDIESMVVLKDAASTAIYGSRGANGVILITTKKGKMGKASINVYGSSTISEVSRTIPVLDAVNYAHYRNDAAAIKGNDPIYYIDKNDVYAVDDTGQPVGEPLRKVNWQDEIFRMAVSENFGLNMSGATEKSNYYMSATFDDTEGVVPNAFLTSSTLQLNYTNNITDRFKVDTKVGMYIGRGSMSQGASKSGGGRSFTRQLISYNPLVNGEIEDDEEFSNPFKFLAGYEEKIDEKRLNASVRLTYDINDDFTYQLRTGSNYRTKKRSRWYDSETTKGSFTNGYLALSQMEKISYTIDNLLIYNKRFDNHTKLNATVGITYDGTDAHNNIYEVGDFPIAALRDKNPQLGSLVITPFSSLGFKDNIFSYLGRFTYTIKNRYMFNASFRADRSSKFQGSNQTGYFPAASFAWTVSNEKFLEDS